MTRAEKRRWQAKTGFILIGTVILGMAAIFGINEYIKSIQVRPDGQICPTNPRQAIPEQRALLIDVSDAPTPLQQRSIRNYIEKIHKGAPKHTRISAYTIRHGIADPSSKEGIAPEFTICKPDDGARASWIYENPELIEKRYKENFLTPLEELVDEVLSPTRSSNSPILEKLLNIEATAFPLKDLRAGKDKEPKRKVYIISDMLQNSKDWSHYKEGTSYRVFRDRGKEHTFIANFHDVEVQIGLIGRRSAENLQRRKLITFWENYFHKMGGKVIKVERLTGAS
ncbi:MAG: hypothetical protein OXU92_05885 [Deltaproteobacteria bacterium]|nr:hypothetical protein [Deltaproteobacteria bacterium]